MKKILLLWLMITLSFSMFANDEIVKCLVVEGIYGDATYFALSEAPEMTYGAGTITVTAATYTIEDMPLSEIVRNYFTDAIPTVDGIGSISAMDGSSTEFVDGKVLVRGLKDGARVHIYTADGQVVGSVETSIDGDVCVDINSLKSGQVYILRTPSTSFKIVK